MDFETIVLRALAADQRADELLAKGSEYDIALAGVHTARVNGLATLAQAVAAKSAADLAKEQLRRIADVASNL